MELTDVMRAAGSVRRFWPDPVPLGMVWGLLDGAWFAPSGGNRQAGELAAAGAGVLGEAGQKFELGDGELVGEVGDAGAAAQRAA
jgi:nitroreductase